MLRTFDMGSATLSLIIVTVLVVGVPSSSGETNVSISIPNGAGAGPSGAPGFSPANVTVILGINNTVVWTNNDSAAHTVTSASTPAGVKAFDSGIFAPDATFTETFTVPGTYEYYCTLHPWMAGIVVVKASPTPSPEFPTPYLAVTLFAVIALVILVSTFGAGSRSHAGRHERLR